MDYGRGAWVLEVEGEERTFPKVLGLFSPLCSHVLGLGLLLNNFWKYLLVTEHSFNQLTLSCFNCLVCYFVSACDSVYTFIVTCIKQLSFKLFSIIIVRWAISVTQWHNVLGCIDFGILEAQDSSVFVLHRSRCLLQRYIFSIDRIYLF